MHYTLLGQSCSSTYKWYRKKKVSIRNNQGLIWIEAQQCCVPPIASLCMISVVHIKWQGSVQHNASIHGHDASPLNKKKKKLPQVILP